MRDEEMRNVNKDGKKSSDALDSSMRNLRIYQEMDYGHRRRNTTWIKVCKIFCVMYGREVVTSTEMFEGSLSVQSRNGAPSRKR